MSKKMPKNYSIKTVPTEEHLVTMYGWKILKDGKQIKESLGFHHFDSVDARKEGLEVLWKLIDS